MSFAIADRVQETTATSGTGTLTLGGATAQMQSFATGIGSGNTCDICILDANGVDWETATGASVGSGTLTRGTFEASSTGSRLALSSGTHTVFCTLTAGKASGFGQWSAGAVSSLGSGLSLSGGALSASGGGGALTLVSTQTASGLSVINFSSINTSTYDYELVLRDVEAGSSSSVTVEFATGVTPTYQTTGYYWTAHWSTVGVASVSSSYGSNGSAQVFGSGSVNFPRTSRLLISGAGYNGYVSWQTATAKTAGIVAQYLADGTVLTGVRIRATSGNFTGGSASLYQLAR